MKRFIAALGLIAGALTVSAADELALTADQIAALNIVTALPVADGGTSASSLSATVVVPNSQMFVVSTPLPALVEALQAAVGQQVKRGQPLARLKSPQLAEAQSALLRAEAERALARDNLERDTKLFGEGIIAESRLRTAQMAESSASASYEEHRQALRLLGLTDRAIATLVKSRAIGSTLTLSAPSDGVILDQLATVGQRLDAAAPIYRLGRLDPLWLEIHAPAARAATLVEGAPVSVPAAGARGKLITVTRSVEPDSQTVLLRASITHNSRNLRPGQRVEATVGGNVDGTNGTWRVPREALVRQGDAAYVFARSRGGFLPVPVSVRHEGSASYVVGAALDARTPIAVQGTAALKAKMLGLGGE